MHPCSSKTQLIFITGVDSFINDTTGARSTFGPVTAMHLTASVTVKFWVPLLEMINSTQLTYSFFSQPTSAIPRGCLSSTEVAEPVQEQGCPANAGTPRYPTVTRTLTPLISPMKPLVRRVHIAETPGVQKGSPGATQLLLARGIIVVFKIVRVSLMKRAFN